MRKKLELDGEFPIVAFAGQMNEIKGVKELLDAWKIVQSRHPSAQLVLLGDDLQNNGAYKNEMLRYSEIHRLNARFVGFQKNVRDWLLASNVSVVPSREEPLGLVVIESMSVGVPVVACNTGGIRETVVDGKTGLLVPVNNYHELSGAISQLLDRPDWAGKLGAAGRSRYEELFSLEHHVESTEQIYQQLLASKII
jgi:glycosyltransferase involved in cell wall biosynthesis